MWEINCIIQWIPFNLITYLCLSQIFLIVDFIKHPMFVGLRNSHHITVIWQICFKKRSIDDDVLYDVFYDDDDVHKDNDHDNPAKYDDNIISLSTSSSSSLTMMLLMSLRTMTTMTMVFFMTKKINIKIKTNN